jgi:hypothetical protein
VPTSAPHAPHAPIFFLFGWGSSPRDASDPIVVLSGWSGADERRDHSAILNALYVDGLRRALSSASLLLFVVRTMRDIYLLMDY